jgi:hypothetical protein
MKREIIPPKGKACVTILFPLGDKDAKSVQKLDCESLQKHLNEIAKEFHCEYAVRLNGNTATAEIAFQHQGMLTDQDEHDYEVKAINFMTEVDKLELPKPEPKLEPECPSHESDDEEILSKKEFVEKLLHDLNLPKNDDRHVCGALIIDTTTHPFCPELTGWGKISYDLLKEMCEIYLKAHEE